MDTAFFKHALGAGLLASLLGVAVPAATALAQGDTGAASALAPLTTTQPTASAQTPGTQIPGTQPTAGTQTSSGTGSAPGEDAAPVGGSPTGGAAPTPSAFGRRTLATWYGPGFYGHTTACGQRLTPKLVGLASRTLPCGTLVQIAYRGHELTAPVLDRGPYGGNGATWDLTSGAARALQIKQTVRIAAQ